MKKIILCPIVLSMLTLLYSCQTAEQRRREQLVDDLSQKMTKSQAEIDHHQKLATQLTLQSQKLDRQMEKLFGIIEEHQNEFQQFKSTSQILDERIATLEKQLQEHQQKIRNLLGQNQQQKKYLEEVLSTLKKISSKPKAKSSGSKAAGQ